MKKTIYISLFVLLLFSCGKKEEEINEDIQLDLAYEEDFTSGLHATINPNKWTGEVFTDTGLTVNIVGRPPRGSGGLISMSFLETPANDTYGASITFRFLPNSGTGTFGLIMTRDIHNNEGGTTIAVSRAGYAALFDARGETNELTRLGSRGLYYVGHLMDADEDITLFIGINGQYAGYYVNGHKIFEQSSFSPVGRYCGFYMYPNVGVNVKNFSTYD